MEELTEPSTNMAFFFCSIMGSFFFSRCFFASYFYFKNNGTTFSVTFLSIVCCLGFTYLLLFLHIPAHPLALIPAHPFAHKSIPLPEIFHRPPPHPPPWNCHCICVHSSSSISTAHPPFEPSLHLYTQLLLQANIDQPLPNNLLPFVHRSCFSKPAPLPHGHSLAATTAPMPCRPFLCLLEATD